MLRPFGWPLCRRAMARLRILELASHTSIDRGGAIQMVRLACELRRRGHQVVCAFRKRRSVKGDLQAACDAGLEVATFEMRGISGSLEFRKFLRDNPFDVIHIHKDRALEFLFHATVGMDLPVIVANWGNCYPLTHPEAARLSSPKVSKVIAVAEAVKRMIILTGKVDPNKIQVIYGGVDAEEFNPDISGAPIRAEFFNGDASVPVVGMVANYNLKTDKKKAHHVFFQAAREVIEEVPETRFLVVGQGDRPPLEKACQELGVLDHVIFTGFRTDVAQLLAAMDVSISSSTEGEGLTGALRESLAMAKPVVATNIGGNPELVINGQTGLLIPPDDAHLLAGAILKLMRDRDLGRRLGQNGLALVRQQFLNSTRCDQMEQLYQELVTYRACLDGKISLDQVIHPATDFFAGV